MRRWTVGAVMMAAGSGAPIAGAEPSFRGLGIPDGGVASFAADLSADGRVVVGSATDSLSNIRATRWTLETGNLLLGFLPDDNACAAGGITGDGQRIVGASIFQQLDSSQACEWAPDLVPFGLGDLPGGDLHSVANDISRNGAVIVGTGESGRAGSEAMRIVSGLALPMGFLPGGGWSEALAVSGDGAVIVGFSENADLDFEPFRWTPSTGMVGLGLPAGAFEGYALGVSDDGAVVVGHSLHFENGTDNPHAFRWTSAAGRQTLGPRPSGFVGDSALAASGDGSVIVGVLYDSLSHPHAMIWDAGRGERLVQDVLAEAGLGLALLGWTLDEATAISPDGRFIVGNGFGPQGEPEAWLAELPVPRACPGDFNGVGGVTVQDLFDFLTAWFAGTSAADFNHAGGVSLQDLFDFLAAWFTPCP